MNNHPWSPTKTKNQAVRSLEVEVHRPVAVVRPAAARMHVRWRTVGRLRARRRAAHHLDLATNVVTF